MKRKLGFLTRKKQKALRTILYGDTLFHLFELELLHTPIFQRLYGLKQLGFADKVYPDAVHSRFNHILGVTDRVERMTTELVKWLEEDNNAIFKCGDDKELTATELAMHVKRNIRVVRLVALTHDLTHAAFGHTLEDEISVFSEKHDDPKRQARFMNCLIAQLVWNWAFELGFEATKPNLQLLDRLNHNVIDENDTLTRALYINAHLEATERAELLLRLSEMDYATHLLFKLDALHYPKESTTTAERAQKALESVPETLLSKIIKKIHPDYTGVDFDIHRDALFIDMVGNTVCADLLDYARRDPAFSGLKAAFVNFRTGLSVGFQRISFCCERLFPGRQTAIVTFQALGDPQYV